MKPLLVHESCRDLPPRFLAQCDAAGAKLRHTQFLRTITKHGVHFVTRKMTGELHLGPEPLKVDAGPLGAVIVNTGPRDAEVWGPPLWRELEAGADTPEERHALAFGMAARLPCGECRQHWTAALRDTPPAVQTAEDFARWVWERHNDVNRRKGKPELPFPTAPAP